MKIILKSCLVGLALLVSSVAQAAIISVSSPASVTNGDSFSVDVLIDDVDDLAGFQFLLNFDPAVLSAASVTSGDIFGLDTFLIDDTISANSVSFAEGSFALSGLNITGSTLLATINFSAIAAGVSTLSLSNVVLSDSFFASISPITISDTTVNAIPQINVSAPASLSFLLAGLLVFIAIRRNRAGV